MFEKWYNDNTLIIADIVSVTGEEGRGYEVRSVQVIKYKNASWDGEDVTAKTPTWKLDMYCDWIFDKFLEEKLDERAVI